MSKSDIRHRDDIFKLVTQFYSKVRKDEILGPFFNETITDWDTHLQHLTTFWESSLFLKRNIMEIHLRLMLRLMQHIIIVLQNYILAFGLTYGFKP